MADFYSHRIQQLRPDGGFVRQWGVTGETGHGAGAFIYPTDVALNRNGMLYVADGYANRIQVFDAAGEPLWQNDLVLFGPTIRAPQAVISS